MTARCALLSILLSVTGCAEGDPISSGGAGEGAGGPSGGNAPISCESPEVACDQVCADLDTDASNCGECGRSCVVPNAAPSCAGGECGLASCSAGFADCDDNPENGCELAIDCVEGQACTTSCASMGAQSCADPCAPICNLPVEICNAIDDDCDTVCDQGAIAGCRVGVHRAYNGANGHYFTTDLAAATAWGLEAANFYYLYAAPAADLRPFFMCPKGGTSAVFYSDSNDCEMTAAPLSTVGFIAPQPPSGPATCGAIPLYRIHLPANNWHFFTTSLPERDAAIAAGWVDQGLAGYVWQSP